MAPSTCHLPNGQNLTVTPVFGGVSFKTNELTNHRSVFPPGWTVVLNEESEDDEEHDADGQMESAPAPHHKKHTVHRYKRPSLTTDHLFISSISSPSNAEFRPPTSPTRQIAMMTWATLYWYFHQPEPDAKLHGKACEKTPEDGRPHGEWKINIRREGIFKRRNVLAKLERMGLVVSEDSSVGCAFDDAFGNGKLFISRRAFWQMDARTYLFTLSPVTNSPFPSGSPFPSRPASPTRRSGKDSPSNLATVTAVDQLEEMGKGALTPVHAAGPFQSNSHLPTYYPPHPPHYVFTNGIRHPLRPKPFRQGETFYVRYIPSLGEYLSFRVASTAPRAPSQLGPWSNSTHQTASRPGVGTPRASISDSVVPTMGSFSAGPNDIELLHTWMNDPRVAHSWGEQGPGSHQEEFLRHNLESRHSFPVIGCFDGKPFGYFEIYWVKEDTLGKYLGGSVGDYDRGIHCLVGEKDYRGPHRVQVWLSALIHYCWLADMRTDTVMMEPRVDNKK